MTPRAMSRRRARRIAKSGSKCKICRRKVDGIFYCCSGGLCGDCLAGFGMPLIRIKAGITEEQ